MSGHWIAAYDPGLLEAGTGRVRLRYLRVPAYKKFRGMYRQRRVVGITKMVLTDEIGEARRYPSPSKALASISVGLPARSVEKTVRILRVEDEEES